MHVFVTWKERKDGEEGNDFKKKHARFGCAKE